MVAVGVTVALPCGSVHGLQTLLPLASVMVSELAVPPLTCHDSVDELPEVIVVGEALKVNVIGTVTVTVCGPAVPPGPVAVREKVVVVVTGTTAEPEVARPVPSEVTDGVIVTDVAFVVAQVRVVVWPELTVVGFAVNEVICGGTVCVIVTVAVAGVLLPPAPVATAV